MAVKVFSAMAKTLLENDRVKVFEFDQKPGEKTDMHSHPDYVVYPFVDGIIKFTYKDGRSEEVEIKAGEPFFRTEHWHVVENVGEKEVRALITELK